MGSEDGNGHINQLSRSEGDRLTPLLEKLNGERVLRRISPPERYEIYHDVLVRAPGT